ncbi:MAG: PDZ domain-containing protein [Bacteroidota bacterium]
MSRTRFNQLPHESIRKHCFRVLLFLLALTQVQGTAKGQRLDLKKLGRGQVIELPFELENDFIVIPVMLDNALPLRFIIDTGAENTIILEKKITDMLRVDYRRTFAVRGADVNTILTAYLATGIDLRLANVLLARNRSMLVLGENYFNFEKITGTNIQGILGADFLMRFIVEFDFRWRVIRLHEPDKYQPSNRHVEVPSTFIRHRPYLSLPIAINQAVPTPRRMLLDSGAGLTLLLHTFGDTLVASDLPVQTVPTYIANGLGGDLEGSVGRSNSIQLAGKELNEVITYFQPLDTVGMTFLNKREGILGNRVMKRFNVVIDYVRHKVYFRPEGSAWKKKFRFDRSGLALIAEGKNLHTYNVANVIPNSPASEAGIQIGDRIVAVNGTSTTFWSLSSIIKKLKGKVGKQVKIRYERDGKYYKVRLTLRELI